MKGNLDSKKKFQYSITEHSLFSNLFITLSKVRNPVTHHAQNGNINYILTLLNMAENLLLTLLL